MERARRLVGWIGRLFGRGDSGPLDPSREDLVVVVSSFDAVEACSTALERGALGEPPWTAGREAVLRHHLVLPSGAVERAVETAALDGYAAAGPATALGDGRVGLVLQRVQVLDALHCAQERSRMASLAQRLDGSVSGWDGLQPAAPGDGAH